MPIARAVANGKEVYLTLPIIGVRGTASLTNAFAYTDCAASPRPDQRCAQQGSAAARLNSGIGTIPIPLPQGVAPPSEIAAPTPELAPIAPLSPQLQTQFSTGGVAQPNMALSPGGSSSASPSESAPSAPGGGGKSLADCRGFWDRTRTAYVTG